MRFWLITSTFYGNRLPGDERGFVGRVKEKRDGELGREGRVVHNKVGEVVDADMPRLEAVAKSLLKQEPIRVNAEQAAVLVKQFQETCRIKGWSLLVTAVMADHVHWVVGIDEALHGRTARQALKAYGSGKLNEKWGMPAAETWWTEGGSDHALRDEQDIIDAVEYVLNQEFPLLIWKAQIRG